MPQVPIGIQDFRKIRDSDAYYVDKSRLIDSILNSRTEVFLFTRPRRFGKSTNLSMLDAYLNLRYAGNTWFDDLEISDIRKGDPEKNSSPVIALDLKGMSVRSYDQFVDRLRVRMSNLLGSYPELIDSDRVPEFRRRRFESVLNLDADESVLADSLSNLMAMLEAHYGRKVVVLVDEYDNTVNETYGQPFQRDILDFIKDMLSSAFKGNGSLRLGVITGVMQIAMGNIFSGLNNLRVNSILSTDMDGMFGFTPAEVERLCSDMGHPERFAEAREWYDGYRFGDAEIYNPWSVLNYVDRGFQPAPYWAGTSGNSIIDDLLSIPDAGTYDDLVALGSGSSVASDLKPEVTFADVSNRRSGIYGVLTLSGYLTAVQDGSGYVLRIPNREMYGVFADTIVDRIGMRGMGGTMRDLSEAMLKGDAECMGASMRDLFENVVSGRVLDNEHSYQAFIAGLLMNLCGNYRVTADFESGEGYHDIRLQRLRGNGPNVVIEIKRVTGEPSAERMEAVAREALAQIRKMGYAHGLEGRTILYGIAFSGKTPTIVSETIGS